MNAHPVRFSRLAALDRFGLEDRCAAFVVAVISKTCFQREEDIIGPALPERGRSPRDPGLFPDMVRGRNPSRRRGGGTVRRHSATDRLRFFSVSIEVVCATEKTSATLPEPSTALAAVSFIAAPTAEKPGM